MLPKVTLLTAASMLVLAAAMPAMAQDSGLTGNASADYTGLSGHDSDAHSWNGQGSLVTSTGTLGGLNLQGDLGYGRVVTDPGDFNRWTIGGTGFWRDPNGYALGAVVQSTKLEDGPSKEQVTSYGGFGQYYLGQTTTFDGKAGLFNGGSSFNGVYFGGGAKLYAMPDLSISGRIDRTQFNDIHVNDTDYGVKGEYLMGDLMGAATPISVYGGYTRTNLDAFHANNDANVWLAGLKIYFGPGTLAQQDRNGAVDPTETQLRPSGLF